MNLRTEFVGKRVVGGRKDVEADGGSEWSVPFMYTYTVKLSIANLIKNSKELMEHPEKFKPLSLRIENSVCFCFSMQTGRKHFSNTPSRLQVFLTAIQALFCHENYISHKIKETIKNPKGPPNHDPTPLSAINSSLLF